MQVGTGTGFFRKIKGNYKQIKSTIHKQKTVTAVKLLRCKRNKELLLLESKKTSGW